MKVLCLSILILVHSTPCRSGQVKRQMLFKPFFHLSDKIFTDNLLWARDVLSKWECARMCVRFGTCTSFTVSGAGSAMTSCRLHAKVMTSAEPFTVSAGTRYFVNFWLDMPCTSSAECTVDNAECVAGSDVCLCTPGYFYSETTTECVANCTSLGSNFLKYPNLVIVGSKEGSWDEPLAECQQRCLSVTSFTCYTVDLLNSGQCYLLGWTALTAPSSWYCRAGCSGLDHYQRTCLD